MIRASKLSAVFALLALTSSVLGLSAIAPSAAQAAQAGNPSYDLDQCANGGVGETDLVCTGNNWVNGNLGAEKAHYAEGESVPYRAKFGDLTPATSYTVRIAWDVYQQSKHALDYITTYNRTELDANPCSNTFATCGATPPTTLAIPKDTATPAPANQIAGQFTMWGATLNGVSGYTRNGDETSIQVTFTPLVSTPVLAWGGHIASRADWGAGNSAAAISGSPFHMRILDLNGSGGNQDRSLSSAAVIFPASITVVKVAAPKGLQAFSFTTTGLSPSSFTLADDGDTSPPFDRQTISGIMDFTTVKTITEGSQTGWTLTGITCAGLGAAPTVSGTTVSLKPAEAEDVTCTFSNVKNPSITALKTADPISVAEPGGPVKFTVSVHNDSLVESVKLESLTDSPYGNVAVAGGKVIDTTCVLPQTIAPNGTYSCSFHAAVTGDANSTATDVITATAKDPRNNPLTSEARATVSITDVKPLLAVDKTVSPSELLEPGGKVTFSVAVNNPTKEELTLTELTDDKFGSLASKGTCSVPQKIAPGATYNCSFDTEVKGDPRTPHINTITGKARDNENNEVVDTGTATVNFTDVVPKLVVDKSASPAQLPEPGGDVTFKVVVTNPQGAAEPFTLTALQDSLFGNLDGQGDCDVTPPKAIAAGANYTCTFTKKLVGNVNAPHIDVVTATVTDDDGNTVSDKDDATVTFTDVKPTVDVEKTATPSAVNEPGGPVTFQVKVINPAGAVESIEIVSLVDDIYGDLIGKGTCLLAAPLILPAGQSYTCSFTVDVKGNAGESQTDTIIGKVKDDEGNVVEDTAKATVTIKDVLPTVVVDKTADPVSVPETGGPVTFTVRVTNPGGGVEDIFLSELTDSVYGNLNGKGCGLTPPITLKVGQEYVCTFTETVSGDFPEVHTNRVTAAALDDEKNRVTASDDAAVALTDVKPTIRVDKAAAPLSLPEPGGNVTFPVTVTNTSLEPVSLTGLVDNPGAINLAGQGCLPGGTPVTILPGQSYSCSFTRAVQGDAKSVHTDTVTATAVDDEGNEAKDDDSADVTIIDVLPTISVAKGAAPSSIGEPGGTVTFTVVVTNPPNAVENVALTSLVDSVYGNLNGKGDCDLAKAQAIPKGGNYTCSFPGPVNGNAGSTHTDIVTAVAQDNDGNSTPPVTDDAVVTILNVAPEIVVDKLASTSQLPEPGGTVTFTITVSNPGTAEDLTLTSLTDDVYKDLNGKGTCAVPQTIKPTKQYTCTFDGAVKGDARGKHTNTVTGVGEDDEGNKVSDVGSAVVDILDVKPTVLVTKSAGPSTLPEPGGIGTFTVTVTNPASAVEPIKLTSLIDSVFGSLNGKGNCSVTPAVELAPGAQYTCTFTGPVNGNAGFVHVDEVTGTATDNENNKATGTDKAEITVSDVLPAIKVDKTASVTAVHAGDEVTYTYEVRNLSVEPLRNVAVTDDKCNPGSPATLTGGDANSNELLDLTETWTYSCAAKLTGTTTNIATGTGKDDEGNPATDTDTATVNVVDPGILIDKVANLTQIGVGDAVTYTYTVTNPGNAPLADVVVTDDKCGPVTFSGGDTDSDALLDPGEAWKYSCTTTLSSPGSITNIGTVRGKDPIGKEVTGTDTAVVSVLETIVLPATETRPPVLEPAPGLLRTLPVTGGQALRWTACGLSLIAGGSLLRRRRKP